MFKGLNNIPIFRRIFIAFAVATIIPAVVVILLGSFYLNAINVRDQAVQASFAAQSTAYQQQASLQRMNAFLQAYLAQVFASNSVGDPSMGASAQFIGREIKDREVAFGLTLTSYQQNYLVATSSNMSGIRSILLSDDPNTNMIQQQQKVLNQVIQQQWPLYKQLQDQELSILQGLQSTAGQHQPIAQAYTQAYAVLFQADQAFLNLNNSWQSLVTLAQDMGEVVTSVGPSQTNPMVFATVIALLCTILVVVATGTIINFTITQPLRYLATLTRRIAKGDTSARADIGGKDEIHQVAVLMNAMLDNIVKLAQEAQSRHAELQAQVEKLMSEVSGVGRGDLRVQADVTMGELGVLADYINYMIEELNGLIVRVKRVSREVKNSTLMTAQRMAQLVRTADVQIRQIAEAAVEVEQMADSSRKVAERAERLYKMTMDARRSVDSGRETVHQTIAGIGRIQDNVQATSEKVLALDEHSQAINEIITVISSIAQQTNRLALDASVQAAMAGENGTGFAAVASDIRRLAELAKEQVSMISQIVRSVRESINSASVSMRETTRETMVDTKLAQESGLALESIFSVIEQQASEVEAINRAAMQQLQSSSSVVHIMQVVSASTQQSSVSTRETSEQMSYLARLAEHLLTSVEAFKVREESNNNRPVFNASSGAGQQGRALPAGNGAYALNTPGAANQPPLQISNGNPYSTPRSGQSFLTPPPPTTVQYNGSGDNPGSMVDASAQQWATQQKQSGVQEQQGWAVPPQQQPSDRRSRLQPMRWQGRSTPPPHE